MLLVCLQLETALRRSNSAVVIVTVAVLAEVAAVAEAVVEAAVVVVVAVVVLTRNRKLFQQKWLMIIKNYTIQPL